MYARLITLLIVSMAIGCATTPRAEPASDQQEPPAVPSAPVLRLLDITPTDGTQVDSSTVIEVTVAYHIPDFDPERGYRVSAMFAGAEGRMFGRGLNPTQLRSPAGVVTVQQPLSVLRAGDGNRPSTPLTGTIFLFEFDAEPPAADTVRREDRMLVRTSAASRVRARTRTFYFNGAGPARTLGRGFPDVLEEYWTYRSHKAFALAYETPTRWTYGYSFGFESPDGSIERALEECRSSVERRGIDASCEVMLVDQEPTERSRTRQWN